MFRSIIHTSIKFSFLLVDLILVIIMIKVYLDLSKTNSAKNNPILNILSVLFIITTFLEVNQIDKY
jgi:hypothetical protein